MKHFYSEQISQTKQMHQKNLLFFSKIILKNFQVHRHTLQYSISSAEPQSVILAVALIASWPSAATNTSSQARNLGNGPPPHWPLSVSGKYQ